MSDYDIHKEINRVVGLTTKQEFTESLEQSLADHPNAHVIAIIYDEDDGYFEICGSEIPIPYAVGMIHGALDSMMHIWFPKEPYVDEEEGEEEEG